MLAARYMRTFRYLMGKRQGSYLVPVAPCSGICYHCPYYLAGGQDVLWLPAISIYTPHLQVALLLLVRRRHLSRQLRYIPTTSSTCSESLYSVSHLLEALGVMLALGLVVPLIFMLLDYLDYRRLQKEKLVFLELTPPGSSVKSAHATTQLFSVLHGLYAIGSWKDRVLRHKQAIALEVTSSREQGIRYIVGVPAGTATRLGRRLCRISPRYGFEKLRITFRERMRKEWSCVSWSSDFRGTCPAAAGARCADPARPHCLHYWFTGQARAGRIDRLATHAVAGPLSHGSTRTQQTYGR